MTHFTLNGGQYSAGPVASITPTPDGGVKIAYLDKEEPAIIPNTTVQRVVAEIGMARQRR